MGDILVLSGAQDTPERGRAMLLDRPGMKARWVQCFDLPWGGVVVQASAGGRFAPRASGERLIVPIGRPTPRGRELARAPDAMAGWIEEHLEGRTLGQGAERISDALSGMYAIFEITSEGVRVLTDHMGFRPVYAARDDSGAVIGIGTHLESLAACTGRARDLDLVSMGELFAHNDITFPYTTRNRIRELDPCSIIEWSPGRAELSSRVLWEPREPAVFPGQREMRERLRSALLEAGEDLTRGCDNAAVLLSGGIDSRAVLAVLPEQRVGAVLTYVTRENRESRVAGEVARAAGTTQVLVRRDDDFFPMLVQRGLSLLGMELRGNCHGLCVADNGLADRFDVVIGGQLSDTLLKDHFMPFPRRHELRPLTLRDRARELIKGPIPVHAPGPEHTTGREAIEAHLTPEIAAGVRARRERRLEEVRRVRPTTADEWRRFWPCSRQDDSAHTLGNTRLMCSDTLFAHQAIVEAAAVFDPALRVEGALTNSVFNELCGPLAEVMNANTGLPANASRRQRHRAWKLVRSRAQQQVKTGDWNDVQTSWVDPVSMQRHAPFWKECRERLGNSEAAALLSKVIERGGEAMIGAYQDDLPSNTNHIAMQMALWLDMVLSERASVAAEPRS